MVSKSAAPSFTLPMCRLGSLQWLDAADQQGPVFRNTLGIASIFIDVNETLVGGLVAMNLAFSQKYWVANWVNNHHPN